MEYLPAGIDFLELYDGWFWTQQTCCITLNICTKTPNICTCKKKMTEKYYTYCLLSTGLSITEKAVLTPCVREFWEKLCGWVVPASDGGTLNIFAPLAASGKVCLFCPSSVLASHSHWYAIPCDIYCRYVLLFCIDWSVAGMDLMRKLSVLTGLNVRAPTGICTGSYQHSEFQICLKSGLNCDLL